MAKAPLIYLDFDGVLNDPHYLVRVRKIRERGNLYGELDPLRLHFLRILCENTGAELVLVSSWNHRKGVKEFFENEGFKVVGQLGFYTDNRAKKIREWQILHLELTSDKYVIFDDEYKDYLVDEELQAHLICTFDGDDNIHTKKGLRTAPLHMGLNEKHIFQATHMLQ